MNPINLFGSNFNILTATEMMLLPDHRVKTYLKTARNYRWAFSDYCDICCGRCIKHVPGDSFLFHQGPELVKTNSDRTEKIRALDWVIANLNREKTERKL